ncbi:hypothetical protein C475_08621 [Halosimplex carlsbadense 2-9-1]|uniref:Uncharacterized protein n=1 Tax=Halosimplex carlsbadense 2-9-1 TaxID=797114 RepID=M0CUT3_9EURY|nr:hypothetical protein [Halosimplex carlsbadense]ELZ26985.1 hypothetical protein C475_08621 [Halosimplex carlsbadense 2-9-1]
MLSRGDWCGEPQRFTRALRDALVSRDDHLTAEIATEALGMDECYLDEFADDYTDFPAYYYGAKALAAFALDHERAPELLAHLEEGIQRLDDPGQFWTTISDYYHALLDRSQADAQAALDGLFDYYAGNRPEPDDPKHFVLHEICAYILLARRYGLDITIDSERVPAALTREDVPADDVELDIDLSDLTFKSDVGLFELERDDDGTPVIAGRIYHPGGAEVTAADVPEREAGRVLSDDWIEAALDEASWRDHYGDDLVNEARAAFEDGSLVRKLVVVQDRTDGSLFDESLTELPVDDIELMKGAGKRGN